MSRLSEESESLHAMPTLVKPFVELGKLEGERLFALRVLDRKFPRVAEELARRLETLDEASLLAFGEALLFFETESDCLAWFENRPSA